VNARRLLKQVKRELLASPKKAAILGIGLAAAVYFWTPLVWKWVAPKKTLQTAKKPAARNRTAPPAATMVPPKPAAKRRPEPSWTELLEMMTADPLRRPANVSEDMTDPFKRPSPPKPKVDSETEAKPAEPEPAPPPEISPEQVGIKLTGTVVGTKNRMAILSGRSYRVGEAVAGMMAGHGDLVAAEEVAAIPPEPSIEFELAKITPAAVTLRREGKEFVLRLRKPTVRGGRIVLQ